MYVLRRLVEARAIVTSAVLYAPVEHLRVIFKYGGPFQSNTTRSHSLGMEKPKCEQSRQYYVQANHCGALLIILQEYGMVDLSPAVDRAKNNNMLQKVFLHVSTPTNHELNTIRISTRAYSEWAARRVSQDGT